MAVTLRKLMQVKFPPEQNIIEEGILPKNGLLVIGGPPKAGKSLLLGTVGFHITTATPLLGALRSHSKEDVPAFAIHKPHRVLIFEQEVGFQDMQSRNGQLLTSLTSGQRELMLDNLFIHSRDYRLRLDEDADCTRMRKIIELHKPEVVAFDPLSKFHISDENSAQQTLKMLQNLQKLRDDCGFATILNHHNRKSNSERHATDQPEDLRGINTLYAEGDSFIMMMPVNRAAAVSRLEFTVRRGPPISSMRVQLDKDSLRMRFKCWRNSGDDEIDAKFGHLQ